MTVAVTPSDIRAAHARIRGHIRRTPLLETASPSDGAPPVSLKLECLQATGSFKARGAFHNLLTRHASAAGCATASGGKDYIETIWGRGYTLRHPTDEGEVLQSA